MLDKQILHYLFKEFWEAITLFGTPAFYIFIILLISLIFPGVNPIKLIIFFLFLEALCFLLKIYIPKNRPESHIKKVFVNIYDSRAFPSIHSARISLLAFACSTVVLDLSLPFVIMVVLVGYSRIYMHEHDFLDVIAGALLGLIFGILWRMSPVI